MTSYAIQAQRISANKPCDDANYVAIFGLYTNMEYMHYHAVVELTDTARLTYLMMKGHRELPETVTFVAGTGDEFMQHPWQKFADMSPAMIEEVCQVYQALDRFESISSRWDSRFDERGYPDSESTAREFIKSFLQALRRYPCFPNTILCFLGNIRRGDFLDFTLIHPIGIDRYSFYYTINGKAVLHAQGNTQEIPPNSFLLIPPTCKCKIERDPSSDNWTVLRGFFECRSAWTELVDWARHFSVPHIIDIPAEETEATESGLTKLISVCVTDDPLEQQIASNIMENVLLRVKIVARGYKVAGDARISRAANYLVEHLGENISIQQLAQVACMSPSHFSSLFRIQMGASVVDWRDRIRMRKAEDLLRYTGLSVSAIGDRVGYPNALYFSRRFTRLIGESPKNYRESTGM